MERDLERLLALVRRELGAADARLVTGEGDETNDPRQIVCRLPDGRGLLAHFDEPPADRDAKARRLEMLASTFDTVVEDTHAERRSRPPPSVSLHDELVALTVRAPASNAIIIDANSPVVWGAAFPEGVVSTPPLASSARMVEGPANDEGLEEGGSIESSRRAVQAVRSWPELGALRKGRHVRKVEQGGEAPPLLAHSFASIYLVILVFDGPFDELRAERAVVEALPRIERLVLALPPLDPSPFEGEGAIAVRRPMRRR